MYYEFEMGAAFYEVPSGRFDGELSAKRQIKIEDSVIRYVLDSSLTIRVGMPRFWIMDGTFHVQASPKARPN